MKINSLELKNFRNYKTASISFDAGLNVLYGENASGKTNMLESIYLSSVFHSPRTAKDKEMILLGEEKATVKLNIEKKYCKHVIMLQIDSQNKKKVAVDGIPIQRAGELLGVLGVVYFSPDEMKLVKESPAERRRFLDVGLSQQQKSYFFALQRYNKNLKQKNNLLKERTFSKNVDDMLDVWDIGLADSGSVLISKRREFVDALSECAAKIHTELSGNKENLSLCYESDVGYGVGSGDVNTALLTAMRAAREKDKQLGYSTTGPHRDDIKIEINGKDARKFASQGQQRTVALAMKLSEVELYCGELGEPPVLLLDDVLSELDEGRRETLLRLTSSFQTIITCTEYDLKTPAVRFEIKDGTVQRKI